MLKVFDTLLEDFLNLDYVNYYGKLVTTLEDQSCRYFNTTLYWVTCINQFRLICVILDEMHKDKIMHGDVRIGFWC